MAELRANDRDLPAGECAVLDVADRAHHASKRQRQCAALKLQSFRVVGCIWKEFHQIQASFRARHGAREIDCIGGHLHIHVVLVA